MWWKIYFWIYGALTLIGLLILVPTLASWNFAMWEGIIENTILVIGAYSYTFQKKVFDANAWKYIFVIILMFWIGGLVYYLTKLPALSFLELNIPMTSGEIIISIVISLPALLGIYKLGFSAKEK